MLTETDEEAREVDLNVEGRLDATSRSSLVFLPVKLSTYSLSERQPALAYPDGMSILVAPTCSRGLAIPDLFNAIIGSII